MHRSDAFKVSYNCMILLGAIPYSLILGLLAS